MEIRRNRHIRTDGSEEEYLLVSTRSFNNPEEAEQLGLRRAIRAPQCPNKSGGARKHLGEFVAQAAEESERDPSHKKPGRLPEEEPGFFARQPNPGATRGSLKVSGCQIDP
jgi:hypothetical protein